MSDRPVARARHSETKQVLSVFVAVDDQLEASIDDGDAPLFIDLSKERPPDREIAGEWRHFKGGVYWFHALVARSPDGPLVLYSDSSGQPWLRPQHMINERIVRDDYDGPRFVRLD